MRFEVRFCNYRPQTAPHNAVYKNYKPQTTSQRFKTALYGAVWCGAGGFAVCAIWCTALIYIYRIKGVYFSTVMGRFHPPRPYQVYFTGFCPPALSVFPSGVLSTGGCLLLFFLSRSVRTCGYLPML